MIRNVRVAAATGNLDAVFNPPSSAKADQGRSKIREHSCPKVSLRAAEVRRTAELCGQD